MDEEGYEKMKESQGLNVAFEHYVTQVLIRAFESCMVEQGGRFARIGVFTSSAKEVRLDFFQNLVRS
jgi:hypothetical protein